MKFTFYIFEASRLTFHEKKLFATFILLWAFLFVAMFSIPLNLIPGNDLQFQMSIFKTKDYILLAVLSFLSSLVIAIQINIFRNNLNSSQNIAHATLGGVGVFSGIFSSIFASATCAMCLGALFSFLGFGTVFFFVQNRWYILVGAILLLLISLYLASRRLVMGCQECMVQERH